MMVYHWANMKEVMMSVRGIKLFCASCKGCYEFTNILKCTNGLAATTVYYYFFGQLVLDILTFGRLL
jgi:hypothetical protein